MQMIVRGVVTLRVPMIAHIPVLVTVKDYVGVCVAALAVLQVGKTICFQK